MLMDTDDLYRFCFTLLLGLGILSATFSPDSGAAFFFENPFLFESEAGIHMVVEDEFLSQVTATAVHSIDLSGKTENGVLFEQVRFPVKFKFSQYPDCVLLEFPGDKVILRC